MSNQASNISSVDLAIVPGTVYIQDCVWNQLSKLYTLDLATGKATFIGEIINRSLWYYLCWFSTLWHRSSTSSIKCSLLLTSHHWNPHSAPPTGTHAVGGAECGLECDRSMATPGDRSWPNKLSGRSNSKERGSFPMVRKRVKLSSTQALIGVAELLFCPV